MDSLPGTEDTEETLYGTIDRRWSHLRKAQEAARLLREGDSGSVSPPPLSSRQMEQYAATYSRATSRQLSIHRKDGGFGFTLRHFIVYPPEEGENEGPLISDPQDTIFVKSVKDSGPAVLAGLDIGDRIVSVNGESVAGRSYAQVVQMIQKSRDLLRLEVVPKQDDFLQVYYHEIAQNPETNKRIESAPPLASKPHWPASVCSSSSRESSPLSSKTSDSARDSVYGHSREATAVVSSAATAAAATSIAMGPTGRNTEIRSPYQSARMARQAALATAMLPSVTPARRDWENVYETISNDRLKIPSTGHSSNSGSVEHVYAVPALASSSTSTLGSGPTSSPNTTGHNNHSRDSLDSDSSVMAGFSSPQDDPLIHRIKKDCERKEEFLKNQTYPAYLSSPPKDIDSSPYGIASLATTMPPPKSEAPPPKKEEPAAAPATKNFFMDIYAKEVSKMQSVSKSSATAKKRNFDATQFNTYGLPLGYRRGGNGYDIDNFSRNNFVIVGSRTLHCEPPQSYQPIPEPPVPACAYCYGPVFPYAYPVYPSVACGLCSPPTAAAAVVSAAAAPFCPECSNMTMTTPYQPRPPRPSTLPGIQSLQTAAVCHGRHVGPPPPALPITYLPPTVTTPVHMHPDPQNTSHDTALVKTNETCPVTTPPNKDPRVHYRRKKYSADDEEDRNLRRVSYLQATKEERMDTEENLANETGIAPTHSIKKLKSIFSEKSGGETLPPPLPPPPSPKIRDVPKIPTCDQSISSSTLSEGLKEGYLTCKVAVVDGKKATDRSWKTVYCILKAKALYMYKDKKMAQDNLEYEEKPVKLAESEVEVASDYTKRKNVFRVKTEHGSEYLFQADNELLMKEWVRTIDDAAMAIIVDERKDGNKLRKLTSFRNKSPTGTSPATKNRKSSADQVPVYKEKDKEKKNWKGKVVKQLKKMGGGGHGPLYPEGGSIGVPLDECPLCSDYEFVPYLVKVCCDIVNERGLDIVGIYRVPGNNAAVTYLTEQINKGVDHFALDDQRWQDVNVVSSLLKSFFRKLPDPLFTVEMYSQFIEASKIEMANKRLESLRKLLRELPEIHLETLRFLTQHLCNVAGHSFVNKMEVRNLAIVFGPTLVRATDDNMVSMVTDMSQQCRIIESLLSNWDYFFSDTEDVEVKEENYDDNIVTGAGNQSIMLANLHKLEDAGKINSPKGDVSAKDLVTSIISAANRKMLRAATKTSKKENMSEMDERSLSRLEEGGHQVDSRRESESVIHGALQIASAVSLSVGSVPGSRVNSGRETPNDEMIRPLYTRQGSRGSITNVQHNTSEFLKRRGSLPVCQSKRGSICAYSGGAVCESTPVGEVCEARLALMKSDAETVSNGFGESQEMVTGKLSLVSVGTAATTVTTTTTSSSSSSSPSPLLDSTTTCSTSTAVTSSSSTSATKYKFPIETYNGLDVATAERRKKFEAETIAMMSRTGAEHTLGRSQQDLQNLSGRKSVSDTTSGSEKSLPSLASGSTNSLPPPATSSTTTTRPASSKLLTSVTTPIPDANPLDGGILMEDPYPTDAYDRFPDEGALMLNLGFASSLPSLRQELITEDMLSMFDTGKVAARGTLQRLKTRGRNADILLGRAGEAEDSESVESSEALLLFINQKMRHLLDPNYQEQESSSSDSSPLVPNLPLLTTSKSSNNLSISSSALPETKKEQLSADGGRGKGLLRPSHHTNVNSSSTSSLSPGTKKVELRRSGRVDPSCEPEGRRVARVEPVLRQVNNRKALKRSESLTKRGDRTEANNLRSSSSSNEVEKENKVLKMREHFEQNGGVGLGGGGGGNNGGDNSLRNNKTLSAVVHLANNVNFDVNKVRKKLADGRQRRIKRRHTVGGTKDFTENILSKLHLERPTVKSSWDRLAQVTPVNHPAGGSRLTTDSSAPGGYWVSAETPISEWEDGRRFSLPDCGPDAIPMESHV